MKNIRTKLIAYFGIITLLSSLFMGLVGVSTNNKDISNIKNHLLRSHVENNMDLAMKYLRSFYGPLQQCNGALCDRDGNIIEGRTEMVDSILEDLGDKSTIFIKDRNDFKRISTSIISEDDERAIGTYLGTNHSAYETIMKGELYVGEADILGDNYYTAYQPLKDDNNNIIGILFVGTPTKALDNIIQIHDEKMDKINILIIALRIISLSVLIALASILLLGRRLTNEDDDKLESLCRNKDELVNASKPIISSYNNLTNSIKDIDNILEEIGSFSKELSNTSEHSLEQLKKLTEELNRFVEKFEVK